MSAVAFAVSAEHITGSIATDPMITLQTAAEAKDEYAFGIALQAMDWAKRPPADFLRAVDLALMAGAYLAARRLATQGASQYPNQPELQQLAQLLAPPQVTAGTGGPQVGVEANRMWLRTHWEEYRGQWVALRYGQLLGVADSLDALVAQVGNIKNNDTLVTALW